MEATLTAAREKIVLGGSKDSVVELRAKKLNNTSSRARKADEQWLPATDTVLVDLLANLGIIVREYVDGTTFEVA